MNSLLIDTSNQPLSVALMQNDEVLAEITTDSKQNHSVQLMPAISQLFEQSKIAKQQLDAIIVAEGPGSYTGLRIGVTVAKTLAYALDVKLYGVSSLKALAATIDHTDKLLVPVFDARRTSSLYRHIPVAKWSISDYFRRSIYVDRGIASFFRRFKPTIYLYWERYCKITR